MRRIKQFITLLFILGFFQYKVHCKDELILVIEHFRHGARGPLKNSYDSNEQGYQWGQLTDVGQNQQYQLGRQIRKEYIEDRQFLRPYYNHTEIVVYSTEVNRTIMSAHAYLLGLYPPGTGPKLSVNDISLLIPPYQGLEYQEVEDGYALPYGMNAFPIHTVSNQGSILPYYCPNYDKLLEKNLKKYGDFLKNLNNECSNLYKEIGDILGEKINNLQELMTFEDVLTSDIYQQRKIPDQITQDHIKKIQILRSISWFVYQTGDVSKALSSNSFNYILQQFQNKIRNNSTYKYIVLSGHDSTMSRQMLTLNISNHECQWQKYQDKPITSLNCEDSPRFASNLIYELYQSENNPKDYYVMIKYNNKYQNLCEKKSTKCAYSEFASKIEHSIGSYEDLCGIRVPNNDDNDYEFMIQALTIISIILAILTAILGLSFYKLKKQVQQNQYSQELISSQHQNQSDINNNNKYVEMEQV